LGFLNLRFEKYEYDVTEDVGFVEIKVSRCQNESQVCIHGNATNDDIPFNYVIGDGGDSGLPTPRVAPKPYSYADGICTARGSGCASTAWGRKDCYTGSENRNDCEFVKSDAHTQQLSRFDMRGRSDYAPEMQAVWFRNASTSYAFKVIVTNDMLTEVPDERINVRITSPGMEPSFGGPLWTIVRLRDDGDGGYGTRGYYEKHLMKEEQSASDYKQATYLDSKGEEFKVQLSGAAAAATAEGFTSRGTTTDSSSKVTLLVGTMQTITTTTVTVANIIHGATRAGHSISVEGDFMLAGAPHSDRVTTTLIENVTMNVTDSVVHHRSSATTVFVENRTGAVGCYMQTSGVWHRVGTLIAPRTSTYHRYTKGGPVPPPLDSRFQDIAHPPQQNAPPRLNPCDKVTPVPNSVPKAVAASCSSMQSHWAVNPSLANEQTIFLEEERYAFPTTHHYAKYGSSVDISSYNTTTQPYLTVAIVGAPGAAAAYVYIWLWDSLLTVGTSGRWHLESTLSHADAPLASHAFAQPGAVAIDYDWAVVGAAGAERVFVYRRIEKNTSSSTNRSRTGVFGEDPRGSWHLTQVLQASTYHQVTLLDSLVMEYPKRKDLGSRGAPIGTMQNRIYVTPAEFGWCVDIHQDTIVVGSPSAGYLGEKHGTVNSNETFPETGGFHARPKIRPDQSLDQDVRRSATGAAYVFVWRDNATLLETDSTPYDSTNPSPMEQSHDYYLTWQEHEIIHSPDRQSTDRFGESIALDYDVVVVGAPGDDLAARTTWDFEQGNLVGWTRTGTAFDNQVSVFVLSVDVEIPPPRPPNHI
jgi:hypothetical protein